jgi:putative glutamine amidotransferase
MASSPPEESPLRRPVIAVTCDRRAAGPTHSRPERVRPARPELFLNEHLVSALRAGGAEVLLLPPCGEPGELLHRLLGSGALDGVVISGGAFDIHPRHYGQAIQARIDRIDEDRTTLELALARRAMEQGRPVLGLCGGMQALVVAAGGTLIQDIREQDPSAMEHEQPTDPARPWHVIETEDDRTRIWLGHDLLEVNSTHHQGVDGPGALLVTARAPDGTAEAVRLDGHPFCLGVQWHPELLGAAADPLFRSFVQACREQHA